jgi:excisionase family DNA binding protein
MIDGVDATRIRFDGRSTAAGAPLRTGNTERLLFTVRDAQGVWQISRTSIYAAIQKGLVKVVKMGRSTRIPRAEIERIAQEGLGE